MRAFYEISDPEARRIIPAVTEAAARGASVAVKEADIEPTKASQSQGVR
jgi:hypothetical protein